MTTLHGDHISLRGDHMQFWVLLQTACHSYGPVHICKIYTLALVSWFGTHSFISRKYITFNGILQMKA